MKVTLEELLQVPEMGLNEWFETKDSCELSFRYRYLQPFWNYVKHQLSQSDLTWDTHFCPGSLAALRDLYLENLDLWGNKTVFAKILAACSHLPAQCRFQVIEHDTLQDSIRQWRMFAPDFPEMCRLMLGWTEDFIIHVHEVVSRISDSYTELIRVQLLPLNAGKVLSVSGKADLHNGRCIHFLTFENGAKLVYKPKSLQIDGVWHRFLNFLTDKAELERFTTYKILDQEAFGFSEFLETAPIRTESEFADFYFNAGFLLGALYFLQGYDIHSENLLACGKHPVLIDLETVIRSGNASLLLDGAMKLEPFERDSVIRTHMLPFLIPYKSLEPSYDALSSEINNSSNLPFNHKGEKRHGRHYAREVSAGFLRCYDTLLLHGSTLFLPDGPLYEIADCEIRVLLRGTAEYQRYLNFLSQKAAMADENAFHEVLLNLKKHYRADLELEIPKGFARFYQQEYAAMHDGYIPRIVIRVNEQLPFANPYDTCLAYLVGKARHLSTKDRDLQNSLILKCLSDRSAKDRFGEIIAAPWQAESTAGSYESRLTLVTEQWIAGLLAHLSQKACNGYIVERQHHHFYYAKLEACFSEGYLGVVPALAEWVNLTQSPQARTALQKIADRILSEFSRRAPSIYGEGFVDGLEGIGLISWRAYQLTGMDCFASIAQQARAALMKKKSSQEFFYVPSLLYTQVASICTLGAMAEQHPEVISKLQELAAVQLELLQTQEVLKPGLATGTDGILLALLSAKAHLSNEAQEQLDAICKDFVSSTQPASGDYSLATGLAGRLLLQNTIGGKPSDVDLPVLANKTLAFGAAGVLFVLDHLSSSSQSAVLAEKADAYATRLLADCEATHFALNRPSPEPLPSFLYGEGGVYYSLICHLRHMKYRQQPAGVMSTKEMQT